MQKFPVDPLKIDRSFITGLKDNKEGEALIPTLVQLGKALSIETVAEGIEMQHELSLLQGERCDSGQGFLFAKPLDLSAIDAFLMSWVDDVPGPRACPDPMPATSPGHTIATAQRRASTTLGP